MLDCLHLDVGRSRPLNICLLWGLDEGNYLLVDGRMIALTVTIKLVVILYVSIRGIKENSLSHVHAMGNPLTAEIP